MSAVLSTILASGPCDEFNIQGGHLQESEFNQAFCLLPARITYFPEWLETPLTFSEIKSSRG